MDIRIKYQDHDLDQMPPISEATFDQYKGSGSKIMTKNIRIKDHDQVSRPRSD